MSKFISVSYEVEGDFGIDETLDATVRDFMLEYGLEASGSGTGGGSRDLTFDGSDAAVEEAEAAKAELLSDMEAEGAKGVEFYVDKYDD